MIEAIVLAAGASRRMGTQKLLLPFAGQTVIGHIVDQVAASPIHRIIAVAQAQDGAVANALLHKRVTLVENPADDSEMLHSIRIGLRACSDGVQAAIIVLGDQPAIRSDVIKKLAAAYQPAHAEIVLPLFRGQRGHPLLVGVRHFSEILKRHDGIGLRGFLAAHAGEILELAVDDDGVTADMDYPADYQRELARYAATRQ